MARRVQFRRGRALPDNTVYIGRASQGFGRFGNPFAVGRPHPFLPHLGVIADRVHAVACYTNWLPTQPQLCERVVHELRGRDLACWCPLDGGPCHGDVLLALANMTIWALTEQQPWGWAIAHAGKRVENRTWAPPRAVIGKTIAVHGGRRWAAGWQDSALLRQAWDRFEANAAQHGMPLGPLGPSAPYCDEGIVALATLTSAHVSRRRLLRAVGATRLPASAARLGRRAPLGARRPDGAQPTPALPGPPGSVDPAAGDPSRPDRSNRMTPSERTGRRLATFAALAATFDLLHDALDQWGQTSAQARHKGSYGRHRVYRDGVHVAGAPARARAGAATMTATHLGQQAAARHVASYSAGQAAGALAITRLLGYRLPLRALAAGVVLNAATHWILDRRRPLTALARAAGKDGYLQAATVVRNCHQSPDATGPGTATFELDRSAHRAIGLAAAALTAWLATRTPKGDRP